MGFFDSLGSVLGGVGSVAGAVGNIAGLLQDNDNPALDISTQSLGDARQYALAAADPKNAKFRSLAAIIEENLRNQSIRGLQDLMVQHRRERARGGPGAFVNPERRDEALVNAFLEQQHNAGLRAHDYAQQTLGGVADRMRGATQVAQVPLYGHQQQFAQDVGRLSGIGGTVGEVAGTLGDVVAQLAPRAPAPTARGYSDFMRDKAY